MTNTELHDKATEARADATMIAAQFGRDLDALLASSTEYLNGVRECLGMRAEEEEEEEEEDEEELCQYCGEECEGTCPTALEFSDDPDDAERSNRINLGIWW